MPDRSYSEKERKICNTMGYCIILYVCSWELNESLRKIILRHKDTGQHIRKNNPVVIVCFVSLD